ncbi:MAG: ATP-binding cassette domain-containing protein [Synergistaceae bacterium]|jgi:energy-coupling factor transport system ATP-binding protein|nr:ATP-binding cassette domain-containing protein [Synergistaceae bacterium]
MDGPIFSVRGAEYAYKGASCPAIEDVNLSVASGEWVALLGTNGSGKSTLAKMMNALLVPTRGVCFVMGMDTSDAELAAFIRRNVALVFQNPDDQIVASIVEEDVAFGPENLGLPSDAIRAVVERALRLTGLSETRRRGSHSLSGGQKQRLALAGALAMEPKALILDESTSMLDPEGRASFLDCLRELNARGITVIQITHRMEEVVHASRIVVMEKGKIAWDGSPYIFWEEKRAAFGFDIPPELELLRSLRAGGFVPAGTRPAVNDLLEALCL